MRYPTVEPSHSLIGRFARLLVSKGTAAGLPFRRRHRRNPAPADLDRLREPFDVPHIVDNDNDVGDGSIPALHVNRSCSASTPARYWFKQTALI